MNNLKDKNSTWVRLRTGQTLIEVLVAVVIVVVALTAILATATSSISFGGQSGQRLSAINLTREGIEIVEAIRNSNWLSTGQSWPYGLTNGNWLVNYNSLSLSVPDNADLRNCTNCWLCQQANDQYLHCSTAKTYKRMITISDGDLSQEKKIVSTVLWQERNRSHTINLEVRLTNWR